VEVVGHCINGGFGNGYQAAHYNVARQQPSNREGYCKVHYRKGQCLSHSETLLLLSNDNDSYLFNQLIVVIGLIAECYGRLAAGKTF
jgi:hypothetical protein